MAALFPLSWHIIMKKSRNVIAEFLPACYGVCSFIQYT